MKDRWESISPAVREETTKVAVHTLAGVIVMFIIFAILHTIQPDKIPFDYTVIAGGICGGLVAVLNFFLMGLTVQKVSASSDEKMAQTLMRSSYSRRMLMQMLWVIAAIAAPCFQFVAGILPLLFPGAGIKLRGIFSRKS